MKKQTQKKTTSKPTYRELAKGLSDANFLIQVQQLENDKLKADKKLLEVELKALKAENKAVKFPVGALF